MPCCANGINPEDWPCIAEFDVACVPCCDDVIDPEDWPCIAEFDVTYVPCCVVGLFSEEEAKEQCRAAVVSNKPPQLEV